MKVLLAGPGTGKTCKVKDLIKENYTDSKKILVLSFTNATVNDLKSSFKDWDNVSCYTLHSYALLINHLKDFHVLESMIEVPILEKMSADIEIDFDTVSEWARNNNVPYTGFTSLAQHPKVYELIANEVAKANEQLARVERVKRFRILPKEFDPEDEEDPITSTRKIKRQKVYEKFKDLVESMFEEQKEEKEIIVSELGEIKEKIY